jgi:molecular chaperone HtpG
LCANLQFYFLFLIFREGSSFGKDSKLANQLVNMALLANGMLKGEDLDKFVKRSFELIK